MTVYVHRRGGYVVVGRVAPGTRLAVVTIRALSAGSVDNMLSRTRRVMKRHAEHEPVYFTARYVSGKKSGPERLRALVDDLMTVTAGADRVELCGSNSNDLPVSALIAHLCQAGVVVACAPPVNDYCGTSRPPSALTTGVIRNDWPGPTRGTC